MWLRKVVVTPLRVLPFPETPEESNRILRQCVTTPFAGFLLFSMLISVRYQPHCAPVRCDFSFLFLAFQHTLSDSASCFVPAGSHRY